MNVLVKALLMLVYVAILPIYIIRLALGRDTLQLRRPTNVSSYWIIREANPDGMSYFSEASVAEGRPALREGLNQRTDPGAAPLFTPLLKAVGRFFAPPRDLVTGKYVAGADREEGIPDEVYTLW